MIIHNLLQASQNRSAIFISFSSILFLDSKQMIIAKRENYPFKAYKYIIPNKYEYFKYKLLGKLSEQVDLIIDCRPMCRSAERYTNIFLVCITFSECRDAVTRLVHKAGFTA